MKKLISMILCALFLVCFVGCDEKTSIQAEAIVLSQNRGRTDVSTCSVLLQNADCYTNWRPLNTDIAGQCEKSIAISEGQTNVVVSDVKGASAVCLVIENQKGAYQQLSDIEKDFADSS